MLFPINEYVYCTTKKKFSLKMQLYCAVPIIKIDTEKVVMPTISSEVSSVRVAEVTSPASRNAPSLFHVSVNGPFALAGFQLFAVMLNDI